MQIPRFSENHILDTAIIAAISTVVVVVGAFVILVLAFRALSALARATRVDRLAKAVETLRKPMRAGFALVALLSLFGGSALFGVAVWKEIDLHSEIQKLLDGLSTDTLLAVLRVFLGLVVVLVGSLYLRRLVRPLVFRLEGLLLRSALLGDQAERVQRWTQTLPALANNTVVFLSFKAGSSWLGLPVGLDRTVGGLLLIVLVINGMRSALLGTKLLTFALERLGTTRLSETKYGRYYNGMRNLWPLAQRSFEAVAWIFAATLVIGEVDIFTELEDFGPVAIRLVGIFFVARVLSELARVLVDEWFTNMDAGTPDEIAKRRRTLGVLIQNLLRYTVFFVAVLVMLSVVGVDPGPFLAGAGILGLAVGLGAQELIGDILQGFILMFEGRLNPGDYVRIGDADGHIENITMRVTEIRDAGGRVHTIRNGKIGTIVNYSREWVHALVDVVVPHDVDYPRLEAALAAAGAKMKAEMPEVVREPLVVEGIEEFADHGMVVRTTTRVGPGQHSNVEGRLRVLMHEALAAAGIDMPHPVILVRRSTARAEAMSEE